jgi:hypothetical protein
MYEVWVLSAQDVIGDEFIEFVWEYLHSCDTWGDACASANLVSGTVMLNDQRERLDERRAA